MEKDAEGMTTKELLEWNAKRKDAEKAKEIVTKWYEPDDNGDTQYSDDLEKLIAEALSQARSEGYEEGKKDGMKIPNEEFDEAFEDGIEKGWNSAITEAVRVIKSNFSYYACHSHSIEKTAEEIAEKLSALKKEKTA